MKTITIQENALQLTGGMKLKGVKDTVKYRVHGIQGDKTKVEMIEYNGQAVKQGDDPYKQIYLMSTEYLTHKKVS